MIGFSSLRVLVAASVCGMTMVSCTAPPVPTKGNPIQPPTPYHDKSVSTANAASLIVQSGMIPISIDGQPVSDELRTLAARRDVSVVKQTLLFWEKKREFDKTNKPEPGQLAYFKINLGKPLPMQSVEWLLTPGHHKIRFAHLLGRRAQGTVEVEGDFGTSVQYGLVSAWSNAKPNTAALAANDDSRHAESHRQRCATLSHRPTATGYYNAFFAADAHPGPQPAAEFWVFLAERDKTYPQSMTGGWRNGHAYPLNVSQEAKEEVKRVIKLVYPQP